MILTVFFPCSFLIVEQPDPTVLRLALSFGGEPQLRLFRLVFLPPLRLFRYVARMCAKWCR